MAEKTGEVVDTTPAINWSEENLVEMTATVELTMVWPVVGYGDAFIMTAGVIGGFVEGNDNVNLDDWDHNYEGSTDVPPWTEMTMEDFAETAREGKEKQEEAHGE